MANSNFVVQNGLTVGGLTIFAGNGDVISSGNLITTGSGSINSANGFGGLNPASIYNGASNVSVTANNIFANISSVNVVNTSSTGVAVTGTLSATGITQVTDTTQSTATTNGALVVSGGVGIAKDLHVGGNIYTANLVSTTSSVLEVTAPLVYLEVGNVYPYNYDIGMYSHFIGGPANVYAHTGAVRSYQSGYWGFFSNVKQEPGISNSVNWSDAGIIWDPIKAGALTLANTTPSTSTSTGALQVAGGVGITGNLWVGGNINFTGQVNAITSSSGSFIGNTTTGYGALYVGIPSGYVVTPSTPLQIATNANTYSQLNMQNINSGTQASSDYIVTADNGTDSSYYGDFGIGSSTYAYPGDAAIGPNDVYLLGVGYNSSGPYTGNVGNVVISSSNGMIKLLAGGANAGNVIATITNTGVMPGANLSYSLGSTTNYWNNTYVNALTATGITVNTGKLLPGSNLTVDIGSTTAWFNNIYGTATHALYADLAENYLADRTYHAGTVLMFGGAAEVTMADADTKRVAGVVSTNPAHLMNGALQGSYVTPLALMGRVPCQVIGPIAKGDLLVSAGWGYAKANNDAVAGQIIGKALEDFPQQVKGLIEVVVGRV